MLTITMGFCLASLAAGDAAADGRLPGSKVSIQEAVGRAQIIVVTVVADIAPPTPGPSGVARHLGVTLKPSKGLKGGTGTRELALESLDVLKAPEAAAEAPPEKGPDYLFLIEQPAPETNETPYRGIKVLPATKENLEAVADAQRREVRWPGSWRNINDVARDAQLVVVARLVEPGRPGERRLSSMSYGPSRIEVARSLKGKAKAGLAPSFHVVTFPPERAERVPIPGDEYVIFIETRDGVAPHVLRMTPATRENIEAAGEAFRRLRHEARSPMTVRQVEVEVNKEVPVGSSRKHAEHWLLSHDFEYSYTENLRAFSDISRTEPDLGRYGGAIVSIIRHTDTKPPWVVGNIQVFILFDKEGGVVKHKVIWIGTGL